MFKTRVSSRYKIVSQGVLGFMTKKELQEKMPDLAKAYEEVYKGKRPDIKIVTSKTFSFPQEKYSMGSWHRIYAFLNGEVKEIPVDKYYGKEQELLPDSMFLDCLVGNLSYCRLIVHPSNAAPLLKEDKELSDNEYIVLHVMETLKSFAREENYYTIKYGYDSHKEQAAKPTEYKDTLKLLAEKGLVKISASGAAQLTVEGRNRSIQARKMISKIRKKNY